MMKSKVAMALLTTIAMTTALSSCSTVNEVPGDYLDVTLAQSKSATQLLRNVTTERVPAEVIDNIGMSADDSVACLEEGVDPTGTVRSWRSLVQVALTETKTDQLEAIVTSLVATFEEQGWSASALGGTSRGGKLLFSDEVAQSIQILGLAPDESRPDVWDGAAIPRASVLIVIVGPCVRTAGADSDEVTRLST
jgi:hypothetical protein